MSIVILWPDGTVDSAKNGKELLEEIAADPWNDVDPLRMQSVLSDRAWQLFREAVDPALPTRTFFEALDKIGFLSIVEWTDAAS